MCSYYRLRPDSYGGYEFLFPFKDEILAEKISKLLKVTHFSGIFDIEFLIGEDDELYFMEINFRNSGCSYACTDGGFNLPLDGLSQLCRISCTLMDSSLF